MDKIQQLQMQITNLQDRNVKLELENRRLRDLLEHQGKPSSQKGPVTSLLDPGATNVASKSDPAANAASIDNVPHVPLGTQASSWAVVARRNKKKQAPKPRKIESAARGFQPITGPTGFGYVYIPRSRRMSRRDVRSRLAVLGIDSYRILDITFPARSIVGLLVHAQYHDVLTAKLTKAKIPIQNDFEPRDPAHLADPKYQSLPISERVTIAVDIHRGRCLRGIERLRFPVAVAVGRAFVEDGFIAQEDLDEVLPRCPTAPVSAKAAFTAEGDHDMLDLSSDESDVL